MKAEERLENLAMTQKTAGQRIGKPSDLSWGLVPYVKMAILVEAVALVASGALDKLEHDL